MKLIELNNQWHSLSREEKLNLIEKTNERRIEAFNVRVAKKAKKTTKRKTSTKKKTPTDIFALLAKMSPSERENFKLMAQIDGKKTS